MFHITFHLGRPLAWMFSSLLAAVAITFGSVPSAAAVPATSVTYPTGSSATRFSGLAFDTCTAPTTAQMMAWRASSYRGIGVYIGGANRTCAQPQLTATWVTTVSRQGWAIVPIYMGLQAPCTYRPNAQKITPSLAAAQGKSQAADAITKARALGMRPGSAIYGDMEHYDATNASCRTAVLTYLSAWTKELHRQGFVSGVYAHLYSGALHLSQTYSSTVYARPDALWIARWDLNPSLTGWSGISNLHWSNGQRGKQYRGDHTETWGGVRLNIDSDRFDAPVATVGLPFKVISTVPLNYRNAPTTSATVQGSYAPGTTLRAVCQTYGTTVHSTAVWDRLSNGAYVTDYYLSTPSKTTYSKPLPKCTYPYQTTPPSLNRRAGPGPTYALRGTLPEGSLAWVSCQSRGSSVYTTSVWGRLSDGSWVSDYYVSSPSSTPYSSPIRRC